MNELLQRVFQHLPLTPEDSQWVRTAAPSELDNLLTELAAGGPAADTVPLEPLCLLLTQRVREGEPWSGGVDSMGRLYDSLAHDNPSRGAVLQFLLEEGSDAAMDAAVDRLNNDPPRATERVAQALSVLYRDAARVQQAMELVDRCWPALQHINVASPLLDLMNYLSRKHAAEHAAVGRTAPLKQLLSAVVARLEQLSKEPPPADQQQRELHHSMVEEGVPLCVSLCDAMALVGDGVAQAALQQALTLPHRRIRTEAAWALAKLDEEPGVAVLREQVEDPYTRLRAIEYLQELEQLQEIDAQYMTAESRCEAALCAWLAAPTQFGIPPQSIELAEHRAMYWPGFDEEQDCYLFRFVYELPQGKLANLGLAGPVEHAFATDLTHMALDDVFAMFAGWHAEHDEMEDAIPEQLSQAGQLEMERLVRRLRDCGYDDIEPMLFCQFFGDKAVVAQASDPRRPDQGRGWAIADAVDDFWLPGGLRFGPVEASYVYKGRRLLHAFNENES